ncbi:acetamidase/formamidase family protein [Gordonia sp. LSe1-13]|uniref:Acetamidase/formamidase family protein n=1 Tax=Gordonia sesuvii TaxID=3116777 RepID=A0ABU7MGQ3_9ACTN|nr:acetamidase/formamidase family protein [Gordonia sp. LSe1-13]
MIIKGIGRRDFFRAAAALGAGAGVAGLTTACGGDGGGAPATTTSSGVSTFAGVLQPNQGDRPGDHYLPSSPDDVRWGYVPSVHADPVMRMQSEQTVTIDTVSHEGILEDQGRDPVEFFGRYDVAQGDVLEDAIAIAAGYDRTERDFDSDGPHIVTGPIHVDGAEPGDVLKIESLSVVPRVPYGVVSNRHARGALALTSDGEAPEGISLEEVMPPVETDGRPTGNPEDYGNVSTFTPIDGSDGVMTYGDNARVRFPLQPFMGMMGVAFADDTDLTADSLHSVPPTIGGGNIDIRLLGEGSTFYLPVFAPGALFYVGDPHMAQGDGEVALTAMEGSVRSTFRLTVCKPGSGDAPSVAYTYPFAEDAERWIPIGLSDPDGSIGGQDTSLGVAMRRAVVNALDFLEQDRGMDRATAYAYLSAAADFSVSQVVDRTVGVHGQIYKAHFED